jgi:probable rRNA maturation factor
MIEVEVLGAGLGAQAPPAHELRRLCVLTASRMGVEQAHVAVEFVDAARIAQLNGEYRGKATPTDVLSFPIDGAELHHAAAGVRADVLDASSAQLAPLELGDIIICPEHTADVREAVVHGMLHLLGMDHETDDGEMLALQRELLAGAQQ